MAKVFRVVITECIRTEFIVEASSESEVRDIVEDEDFDLNSLEQDVDSTVEEIEVEACDPDQNYPVLRVKNGELEAVRVD